MYTIVKIGNKTLQVDEVRTVTKKEFIGIRVREARKAKNWTQRDLVNASRAYVEEDEMPLVSQSYLSEIETGTVDCTVSMEYLFVLAQLLGKRVDFFLPKEQE